MNDLAAPSDCRRCGVCCCSDSTTYVRVMGDDWSRLGSEAGRWAHFVENRAYMRMRKGHCAALEVKRMPSGAVDFFCAIYARRPATCRDLGRGSAECLAELDRKAQAVA